MEEKQRKQLKLALQQLKDAYDILGKNEVVMQDLRSFCAIDGKQMMGGNNNLDPNKGLIMTGRAMVFERIDYFVNTPIEQILLKYGA